MNSVVVLDINYQFVGVETIKKAMRKIITGKAEVIKSSTKILCKNIFEPLVIKLLRSISHVYNRQIPWTKRNIYLRDGGKCQYCGTDTGKMTIDHVIPQCKGGKNTYINTVLACYECNQRKGDKNLDQVGMKLIKQPRDFTLYEMFLVKMKQLKIDFNNLW